jgi:peptidoglycan/LPS O-acetylase OafA/YrhL
VALTVLAIFPGIAGVFSGDWWRYYFFLQLYSYETLGHGIPVVWSLCVEVTYYALLPLWAMAVARVTVGSGPRAWLWAELAFLGLAAAVGIAFQVAGARNLVSDLVAQSLAGQSTWLALGMALAVASVAVEGRENDVPWVRTVIRHPSICWAASAAALLGLAALLQPGGLLGLVQALAVDQPVPKTLAAIVLTAAFTGLLVLPAVFGERAGGLPRRILAAAPIAWLGLVSYGIFLWHLAVTELIALPEDPQHFSADGLDLVNRIDVATTPVIFTLVLAVTSILAGLSYYIVELPFLRRKEG